MASSSGTTNPVEQVTQTMKTVTDALKSAGEKAAAGNQEIAQVAMKQAQDNAAQLLETLRTLAANRNPTDVAAAYSRFVTESAQKHGAQLMEIGELMAKTGKETWGPVVEAMMKAAKPGG